MILNDEHIEILSDVRAGRISDEELSRYICINITSVISNRYHVEEVEDSVEAMRLATPLLNAIRESLDDNSTMFIYLRRTIPDYERLPIEVQDDFADLARLAWLDKMIESRTIA